MPIVGEATTVRSIAEEIIEQLDFDFACQQACLNQIKDFIDDIPNESGWDDIDTQIMRKAWEVTEALVPDKYQIQILQFLKSLERQLLNCKN